MKKIILIGLLSMLIALTTLNASAADKPVLSYDFDSSDSEVYTMTDDDTNQYLQLNGKTIATISGTNRSMYVYSETGYGDNTTGVVTTNGATPGNATSANFVLDTPITAEMGYVTVEAKMKRATGDYAILYLYSSQSASNRKIANIQLNKDGSIQLSDHYASGKRLPIRQKKQMVVTTQSPHPLVGCAFV